QFSVSRVRGCELKMCLELWRRLYSKPKTETLETGSGAMDNFLSRYRNVSILVAVLLAQVLGLAVQVKRSTEHESTRLIRVWTVSAVSPLEKAIVWFQSEIGRASCRERV